jgi:2-dehydro-3-deoxy-D-gluconate 5-dehydrogenase
MLHDIKNENLLDLKSKIAIVTGGSKGIGLSVASRLAEAGAHVVIADIDGTTSTVDTLKSNGYSAELITTDVSSDPQLKTLFKHCESKFGKIDILVNNAGIYPNKSLSEVTDQEIDKIINTNLKSVILATKYASEIMKKNGGGKIINITSIDALHPSMAGLSLYDASKHGVWGFTKSTALELAPHSIQVNAIAPGGIDTPGSTGSLATMPSDEKDKILNGFTSKIPMKRMGTSDEIGKVALFLASDMSSYMTGSQIVVDGGVLLS